MWSHEDITSVALTAANLLPVIPALVDLWALVWPEGRVAERRRHPRPAALDMPGWPHQDIASVALAAANLLPLLTTFLDVWAFVWPEPDIMSVVLPLWTIGPSCGLRAESPNVATAARPTSLLRR
ncbi:uncharacterized protein BP5553_08592 [Venustampulla echinocandica]|uniref:Uncharacterized protein n=1 Tax=Venustampulla echinocandica TaxID=2656787 RepID=A0A370TEP4_9HELO|nr:uncharacterized protein BP5553_08592 [Venustampulla echinocandica]RDL33153.1 hypothetical protein BP5553_08592 [Venustampulla echinocandica]